MITHETVREREQVSLRYDCPGTDEFRAVIEDFTFSITAEDRERIRWYLEEYPLYPDDPAPKLAGAAEDIMRAVGQELFTDVFHANDDARDLWARLEPDLNETRVEVSTGGITGWPVPWELLRDPKTGAWLAVRAAEFVRMHAGPVRPARLATDTEPPIRILLVICRPGHADDVPFRSVAHSLVSAIGDKPETFRIDALRPPHVRGLGQTPPSGA
ncbi:MAG TPA: hypothetical protein QGH10_06630 [Armatimonadota bacterium]|nr:hypothetical protein [Armatimonadota bacterium]